MIRPRILTADYALTSFASWEGWGINPRQTQSRAPSRQSEAQAYEWMRLGRWPISQPAITKIS